MRDRIYYKMPDGSIYSVSQRVIDNGVPPLEGAVDLPEDEKEAFILQVQKDQELASRLSPEEYERGLKFLQPDSVRVHEKTIEIINSDLTDEQKQNLIQEIDGSIPDEEKTAYTQILVDKQFPASVIKNITGLVVPDPEKEAKKQARADKLAAIEAKKQADIEAAAEAEKEARKQAAIEKRQETLRIKMAEKQAAEEAARIEVLVAERVAKIEAEKEEAKQAAIEAERIAALEAPKPRNFSTA